ncbi:hypothetical protein K491DRAFT_625122 [Lophiostoma macrostomum CBS 122681]|uniref:Spindle pole body component n=1 Tax=Lophiostoma macrostomum CBS 122681 TaxID=1314788 RepID=A0A6A6TEM5_9PLEO|nr:hypothetical protein K491DRAFT_625122 [Lophiostoma macrostomum CBS 122681]
MDDDLRYEAFATEGLWKPSSFFQDPFAFDTPLFAPLQLDVPSIQLQNPYAPKEPLDRELRLPDLDSFEFGPLPELESLDQSSLSLDTPPPGEEHDIWQLAFEDGPANKDTVFYTWETFENSSHANHAPPYITEAGPTAFDASLRKDEKLASGRVLKGDILLQSLWNLGLGRSSILFSWDAKARTFVPAVSDGRSSGLTLPCAKSLITQFILTGSTFLYLRAFVERTFASGTSIPARVALATCISSILSTFEDHLGSHCNDIESLLQLQNLFYRPRQILMHTARIVDAMKPAKSNEQLASILYQRVLELEEGNEDLRRLSIVILRKVSTPSMDILTEWAGLRLGQDTVPTAERSGFVTVEEDSEAKGPPEYNYNPLMMPHFVGPEDGSTIFETGNSLRFLQHHHPEHPLASPTKFGVKAPELEWNFTWQDIETVAAKANSYEESLRRAILEFSTGSSTAAKSQTGPALDMDIEKVETDHETMLRESANIFDQPPSYRSSSLPDELQVITSQLLSESNDRGPTQTFSPPIDLTSTLSFRPLLAAQAKLVNATTLRLFFRSHQLRLHLSLQRQYHLLGDGVFSSRLASALFDPERESAERHKGTMRSGVHMGLQLGSRDTWPPASSELRLALMGVLSESFHSSALYYSTIRSPHKNNLRDDAIDRNGDEMPGQLAFSIRQLSESEMEKSMDPDSLSALDFLRLQYVPPSPLNLVISSTSLEKYDYIFRFLLRLLRILFVVSHLPREFEDTESRHFRMEAHHFITTTSSYIFQTGIADHWTAFSSFVSNIETQLAEEDEAGELGTRVTSGLEALKSAHEQCLDSILFSLLLRRRQKKVMSLLEEIFDQILLFAKITRDDKDDREKQVKDLYAKLRGKIRVFISVIKGLTGKRGYGKGKGTSEENTLDRLGVLLEMNGYYGR